MLDLAVGVLALVFLAGCLWIGGARNLAAFVLMPVRMVIEPTKGMSRGERVVGFVIALGVWLVIAWVLGPIIRHLPPLESGVR